MTLDDILSFYRPYAVDTMPSLQVLPFQELSRNADYASVYAHEQQEGTHEHMQAHSHALELHAQAASHPNAGEMKAYHTGNVETHRGALAVKVAAPAQSDVTNGAYEAGHPSGGQSV